MRLRSASPPMKVAQMKVGCGSGILPSPLRRRNCAPLSPRTPPERAVSPLPRRAVTGVAEAIAPEVERVLDDRRDDMVDTSKRVELLEEKQYGGGRLEVIYLRPARGASNGYISEPVTLRIWTPPKFVRQSPAARAANVVFLNDGQNVFDGTLSLSGAGWEAARGARALAGSPANSGHVIIVGIDHAGDRRSLYYCPSPPGTGAFPQAGLSGFFPEAEAWVGGEAHAYVDRVVSEIVPFVLDRYGVDNRAEQLTFGGSSLGAVSALVMAMRHPRAFGKVLLESPALWIDYGSFFRAVLAYEGEWPQRVYIGMGAREFSGLTPGAPPVEGDPIDAAFASAFGALVGHLREKGLRDDRLLAVLDKTDRGAVHNEFAWSQRFPKALRFLCGRAVKPATPRRGRGIYWTVPRVPSPGQAVQVFFDRPASRTLKATKTPLTLCWSTNLWQGGEAVPQPMTEVDSRGLYHCTIWVPEDAWELNFTFNDGASWEQSPGNNGFRHRVNRSPWGTGAHLSLEDARKAAYAAADRKAIEKQDAVFFTMPEQPMPGAPVSIYFNRARSVLPRGAIPFARIGFDGWDAGRGVYELQMRETRMRKGDAIEWWRAEVEKCPQGCSQMDMVFHDGSGTWENNAGRDFAVACDEAPDVLPREVASQDVVDVAGGKMYVCKLAGYKGPSGRWAREKTLRVWTPPGYDRDFYRTRKRDGVPVLYFLDGQGAIRDDDSPSGSSWRAAETAAALIRAGELPPFIIVAIDGAGTSAQTKSLQFLPYPPGAADGEFRRDTENWPGGGVAPLLERIVHEIVPMVAREFGGSTDPDRIALAGGSFAGVSALYAAMHWPHAFGSVLVESPALWVAAGRFLLDMEDWEGQLARRIYVGGGTREFSATRGDERPDFDRLLLQYLDRCYDVLVRKGLADDSVQYRIDQGTGDNEKAWASRLPDAMRFLMKHWATDSTTDGA